jgi:hypothetical protein
VRSITQGDLLCHVVLGTQVSLAERLKVSFCVTALSQFSPIA